MIVLDTNVISEVMRPKPEQAVLAWLDEQPRETLYLTAITEAELRLGVAVMPAGQRREALGTAIVTLLSATFEGRLLPFDSDAAQRYGEIASYRRRIGQPLDMADGQIAAIALARGAALATRNVRDFTACGLDLVDPWNVERQDL